MNNKGVTLIELLITLVISAIIIGGTYSMIISQGKVATTQERVIESQQGVRVAMEIMVRDLQMAGFDDKETDTVAPSSNPVQCTSSSIIVEYEKDGVVHTITYRSDNGNLIRQELVNSTQSTEILLENIEAFTLIPNISGEKMIGVRVNVSIRPDQNLSLRSLTSDVTFRNVLFTL